MKSALMMVDRFLVYRRAPPPGRIIPVLLYSIPMDELLTEEEGVARSVRNLRLNRDNRLSGMRAEHLWACTGEATREEFPDNSQYEMDVGPIQADFHEVHLVEDYA